MPFGRHDLVLDPRRPYTQGGDTDTRQSGVYGQLRLRAAEPLTVVLGGRWSWYKTRSRSNWPATPTPWEAGGERVSGHFTPYAAVLYDITSKPSVAKHSSRAKAASLNWAPRPDSWTGACC